MATKKNNDQEQAELADEARAAEQENREELAEAERDARDAEAHVLKVSGGPEVDAEPEPGRPDSFTAGAPEGVTEADLLWWNNSQNRNYMAGDGPMAGITEVEGDAQSASSVDPEIRAATLEENRERVNAEQAERIAEADRNAAERAAAKE